MSLNYMQNQAIDNCSYNVYIKCMKTVGIRELKNQLSRYLRFVKNGEVVVITDRNEVIAEIRKPSPSEYQLNENFVSYLNQQEKEGKIIRAQRSQSIIDSIIKKRHEIRFLLNGEMFTRALDKTGNRDGHLYRLKFFTIYTS